MKGNICLLSIVISCNATTFFFENPRSEPLQNNRRHAYDRDLIIHHEEDINPFVPDASIKKENPKELAGGVVLDDKGNARAIKGARPKVSKERTKKKENQEKLLKCKKGGKVNTEDIDCDHTFVNKFLKNPMSEPVSSPVLPSAISPVSSRTRPSLNSSPIATTVSTPVSSPASSPISSPISSPVSSPASSPVSSPVYLTPMTFLPTLDASEPTVISEFLSNLSPVSTETTPSSISNEIIHHARASSRNSDLVSKLRPEILATLNTIIQEDQNQLNNNLRKAHKEYLPSKIELKENEDGTVEMIKVYSYDITTEAILLELSGENLDVSELQKVIFSKMVHHIQDYYSEKIDSIFDYYFPSLHFNFMQESELITSEDIKRRPVATTYFVQVRLILHVESADPTIIMDFQKANTTQILLLNFFDGPETQDLLDDVAGSGLNLDHLHLLELQTNDFVADATKNLLPSKVVLKEKEDGTIDGSMVYFYDISTEPLVLEVSGENIEVSELEKNLFAQMEHHIKNYYSKTVGSSFVSYHLDLHFLEESAIISSEDSGKNQDVTTFFIEVVTALHLESADPAVIMNFDAANVTRVLVSFFKEQALQDLLNDVIATGLDLDHIYLLPPQDSASGESTVYHKLTPKTGHDGSSTILISTVAVSTLIFALGAVTYSWRDQHDKCFSSKKNNAEHEEEADSIIREAPPQVPNRTVRFSRSKYKNSFGVDDHDSIDSDVDSFLDWSKPVDSRRAWRRNEEMYEYGEVSSLVGVDLS